MKFSEAMLKGFEKVDGRQCRGAFFSSCDGKISYCVLGAVTAGHNSKNFHMWPEDAGRFSDAWGFAPSALNDQGMPWEHIYGMAVAAGL